MEEGAQVTVEDQAALAVVDMAVDQADPDMVGQEDQVILEEDIQCVDIIEGIPCIFPDAGADMVVVTGFPETIWQSVVS